jgi:hypothetical protein
MIATAMGRDSRVGRVPVKQLVEEFGVSRQTIYNDESEGMPSGTIEEARAWRAVHRKARVGGPGSLDSVDDDKLKIERLKAEVYKLREDGRGKAHKNDLNEGKVVPLDDVQSQVSELVLMIKHRLEAIPDEVAPEFGPDIRGKVVELLKEKLYLILTQMSQWELREGE